MMERFSRPGFLLLLLGLGASGVQGQATPTGASGTGSADSGYAAMQHRGMQVMGVEQYTSTHHFEALPDGGRIELVRDADDSAGVARIRAHLRQLAHVFAEGDFSAPSFVHMQSVPGADVMIARRDLISYAAHDVPRGAELRIRTRDAEALQAVHEFLAFQRREHHSP